MLMVINPHNYHLDSAATLHKAFHHLSANDFSFMVWSFTVSSNSGEKNTTCQTVNGKQTNEHITI